MEFEYDIRTKEELLAMLRQIYLVQYSSKVFSDEHNNYLMGYQQALTDVIQLIDIHFSNNKVEKDEGKTFEELFR